MIRRKGWRIVQPPNPNGKFVILLHGVKNNRFGDIFLRRGDSTLLSDSRSHGAMRS